MPQREGESMGGPCIEKVCGWASPREGDSMGGPPLEKVTLWVVHA